MLFKKYPQLIYRIGNKDLTLCDIFKHVMFIDTETSNAFYDYYIQDGETPENVSANIYGYTQYSWLIMLVNGLSDIKNDWFMSESEYKTQTETDYGGDAFYISSLPDIQPGDVLVKVTGFTGVSMETANAIDNTKYRHITDFDPYFRKIRGISGGGTFANGDKILFARRNAQNGSMDPISFNSYHSVPKTTNHTEVLFTEPYEKSVYYFYTSSNVIVDPYQYSISGLTAVDSDTIYVNTSDLTTKNNFARSLLYAYGACGGQVSGFLTKSLGEDNFNKYIKKQKIKVLRPEYLTVVVSVVEQAIQSNEIGKVIRIKTQ